MAIEPIQPKKNEIPTASENAAPAPHVEKNAATSAFGPAYKLDEALKPNPVKHHLPFSSPSAGKTLAELPPINPVGMASLTRISLQNLIDPPKKNS